MENICLGVILGMNSCTSLYFDLKELVEDESNLTVWLKMVFLIHGKEKVNTTTDFGLSYACLNIAGVLKGYWFLEKKNIYGIKLSQYGKR